MAVILIALGANLPSPAGNPAQTLTAALRELARRSITIESRSGFYRTAAWPDPHDPPFVNAVAAIRTGLSPAALLAVLHEVEAQFGRKRGQETRPAPSISIFWIMRGASRRGPQNFLIPGWRTAASCSFRSGMWRRTGDTR